MAVWQTSPSFSIPATAVVQGSGICQWGPAPSILAATHSIGQQGVAWTATMSPSFTLIPGFQAMVNVNDGGGPPPITDTDLDGMDDGWETARFGNLTHPGDEDFDHDGLSNKLEHDLGDDPTSRDAPIWWSDRNVLSSVSATNDFAAVNMGQVKWLATNAYDEMEEELTGGAGAAIQNLVRGFSSTNNFRAVNIGQLKSTVKPFYDRLMGEGKADTYPWAGAAETNDYGAANIGQAKHLFSFEIE